jgi:hypothetical protein
MTELNQEKIGAFLKKVAELKKTGGVDLSAAEDLSLAVMNLISLEEHFFFTGAKTGDASYYEVCREIREMRARLMKGLIAEHEGETWCATKHLLSASMRLIEVGNRYQANGQKETARKYFEDAYRLYSVFWALKTKLVSPRALASAGKEAQEKGWSLETLVAKLADCCEEK